MHWRAKSRLATLRSSASKRTRGVNRRRAVSPGRVAGSCRRIVLHLGDARELALVQKSWEQSAELASEAPWPARQKPMIVSPVLQHV
jgi:hypothetical protein